MHPKIINTLKKMMKILQNSSTPTKNIMLKSSFNPFQSITTKGIIKTIAIAVIVFFTKI